MEGREKAKILPWSNIDCLCVMLFLTIWASHICGELLFQPKDDILGSGCVCGREQEARAAHCIWQEECGKEKEYRQGYHYQCIKYGVAKLVFCIAYSYSLPDLSYNFPSSSLLHCKGPDVSIVGGISCLQIKGRLTYKIQMNSKMLRLFT